ncbi:MAG: hypothetical protein R3359_11905, partial [Marinirhabdus sp.]|nr:hypothetical protein [Marinirhabdus sp.]
TLDDFVFFTGMKDSIFFASNSQTQLQDALDTKTVPNESWKKALSVIKNNELTTTVSAPRFQFPEGPTVALASHQSLDLALTPNGAIASGVALVTDSVPKLLSVFQDQIPQQNDLERIIPKSAFSAVSFTLSDASKFMEHLSEFTSAPVPNAPLELLSGANELGEIHLSSGSAVALKSIDQSATQEALASALTEAGEFREVILYDYSEHQLFKKTLHPFIQSDSLTTMFQLDEFFVFAENNDVAENMISAYKSNGCLDKDATFDNSSSHVSNASSMLVYGMNNKTAAVIQQLENISGATSDSRDTQTQYPLALLQYSFDRDFAHVHFVCLEVGEKTSLAKGGVSELFSKTLENDLLTSPQFFSNHRTGKQNVVVQDITNTMYLLSNTGKTLWTKTVDGAIIGKVHEVDLLRNGKKQMTFVTKNKWYVIDRNGKDVTGFPVKFRDHITQPLQVFDYDNNRKYRFPIVQGREILLYDSKGKVVSGFTFRKAKSNIVLPAEHIRMGNKDYILIAEENGTLNILNRTGKVRVPVSEKFEFSENTIEREGSDFVVITSNNVKKSISANGKVTSTPLEVSNNYHFVTKGNTKVTLDDNLLRINGKLAELPFGIYTAPKIFKENRKTYITVTETQENKVYVFDNSSAMLPNFPIYGSGSAHIGTSSSNTWLVVAAGSNGIAMYQID